MDKQRSSPPKKETPPKRPPQKNFTKQLSTASIILILLAVFALAIVFSPKQPVQRASSSIGLEGEQNYGMPLNQYNGLVISEIMASNNAAVPDSYGFYSDYIEVWNSSPEPISLQNIGLSDRTDKVLFLFPNITLGADERIVVYASGKNDTSSPGSLHAKFKISSTKQETIALFDPAQFIIDQVKIPVLNANQVYALQEDGSYTVSEFFSPGFPNSEEGHLAYRQSKTKAVGTLIINEIMADPLTGITDGDGELGDWVEIHNPTSNDISLKDIHLSDDPAKPFKWTFPDNAVIYANGYYVVFCTGKDQVDVSTNVPHSNFKINAEGETIVLSDGMGNVLDRVTFDNMPRDHSYGLNTFGEYQLFQIATPGLPNNSEGANKMDEHLRTINPTKVYIAEALASNTQIALHEGDVDYADYVELFNSGDEVIDLEGYGLSDNINRPRKWQFPGGASILPGQRKIIYLDKEDRFDNTDYHANFKISQHGGETLTFCDPTGKILDKLHLPAIRSNYSYGRSEGRGGFFYFKEPSPRAENGEGFNGFAPNPEFSLRGGRYDHPQNISIKVPEEMEVRYTLNGDIPTKESPLYEGSPIVAVYPTVLRAKAFSHDPLIEESATITQSYIIGMAHSLPVVSLVADNKELFDPYSGLLATQILNKDTMTLSEIPEDATVPFNKNVVYRLYGKTWRPGFVEVYDQDNTQMVSQNITLALQGQYSLDLPQKSFKVKARASLGNRYIDYPLFDDLPFTQYKGFALRMGGNDGSWTRLADGFQSRLIDMLDTSVLNQAWNPVAVYLNGEYWGHYNMRERIDRFFVAQHEGIPLEDSHKMTILEASGNKVKYGSNKEYKSLIEKVKTLSPGTKPEDLQYILDHIDVDNYFDYMAVEMFFGNSDPGNIRFYKIDGEGQKWKWIFYDMDYGLFDSRFNSPWSYLKEIGAGDQKIDNTLIRKLLENDEMKNKFLTRLGEVFQIYTTETMQAVLDDMVALMEPEMSVHFIRWAEHADKRVSFDSPTDAIGGLRYWRSRITRLRDSVLTKRPHLFYNMVQEEFKLTDAQMLGYFGPQPPLPEDTN